LVVDLSVVHSLSQHSAVLFAGDGRGQVRERERERERRRRRRRRACAREREFHDVIISKV
jgi:hypothetical protein